jgi:aspartate aminotransferase-like enzyme
MGLELFAKEEVRSNTVVAVNYPSGVDDKQFRGTLDQQYRVVIAGGFGAFKGKIFRIGSMGEVNSYHVVMTVSAINHTLMALTGRTSSDDPVEVAKAKLSVL